VASEQVFQGALRFRSSVLSRYLPSYHHGWGVGWLLSDIITSQSRSSVRAPTWSRHSDSLRVMKSFFRLQSSERTDKLPIFSAPELTIPWFNYNLLSDRETCFLSVKNYAWYGMYQHLNPLSNVSLTSQSIVIWVHNWMLSWLSSQVLATYPVHLFEHATITANNLSHVLHRFVRTHLSSNSLKHIFQSRCYLSA
jgi:hypothetical protein